MENTFIQLLINGIFLGSIYALIAIGLTLIFGVMEIVNFAHGEFLMLAMYMVFMLFSKFAIDPYLSMVIILPAFFLIGVVAQRIIIKPIIDAPMVAQLFATFGLSIVLQNLALFLWKADTHITNPSYATQVFRIWSWMVSLPSLLAFLVSVITASLVFVFIKKSLLGKAIRAVSQSRKGAMIVGINIQKIYFVTFGIGSACVGIAACAMSPLYYVFPTVGLHFGITSFVVCVLGGLGSLPGAFLGGLIIGIVDSLSGFFLSIHLKEAIYFVIFLIILIWRPSGLLGQTDRK
jgi:branched-chain amino acid transport system permease protein